jgi:hypothetical protein
MSSKKRDVPGIDTDDIEKIINSNKSQLYNFTKMAIVAIAIIVLIIGIFGSMHWGIFSEFVMSDFVSFIDAYKGMFITLTGSIGIGGAVKNFTKKKEDDGKNVATGGE